MRGILNLAKPSGASSYDVIRRVKRVLGPEPPALGHAGTLDPLASGVLLVLVGAATRVSRFLMESDKEYEAEVEFGARTDTDDATGAVVAESAVPELDRAGLERLLARFTGTIEQVPPAFSALKQNGVPLYRLARRGIRVQARPRTVTVHRLELIDWHPPRARLRAQVSAGTYIRSLARDIGRAAGSEANLAGLVRTRSGAFRLVDAVEPAILTPGLIARSLVPVADALPGLPRILLPGTDAGRLARGQRIELDGAPDSGFALAITDDRRFLAVVRADHRTIRPVRIVYAET